jgi:transketolase
LTRQKLPVLDLVRYPAIPIGVARGSHVLAGASEGAQPDVGLIATGSEVHLALNAPDRLAGEGLNARVVSLPSWSLFKVLPELYGNQVLPAGVPPFIIEAGVTLGWNGYVGPPEAVIGVDRLAPQLLARS